MKRSLVLCAVLLCAIAVHAQVVVERVESFTHPKLAMTVVSGEVKLPAGGTWVVESPEASLPVRQIMIARRGDESGELAAQRLQMAMMMMAPEVQRQGVQQMYSICMMYAMEHDGKPAASRADLESYGLRESEWFDPDNYFVVPNVPVEAGQETPVERQLVILETRPVQNDGLHWVAWSDGTVERRKIDQALVKKHAITITPRVTPEQAAPETEATYSVRALVVDAKAPSATVILRNRAAKKNVSIVWNLQAAQAGGEGLFRSWATQRAATWLSVRQAYRAPVLEHWLDSARDLYGAQVDYPDREESPWRNRGRSTSAFSVLGGRAAVRETLQMQAIDAGKDGQQAPSVPISTLRALEVKSHPFEEMLKGGDGGSLPLADLIPADHAFAYVSKPSALFGFLNAGSEFIFEAGSMAMQDTTAYNLKDRYLGRLGIDEAWIRGLEKAGVLKDMVAALPDLFLIDGTEVSVIARVSPGVALKTALAVFGLGDLGGEVKALKSKSGRLSYWMLDGDRLYISTSQREMETLKLVKQSSGMGSLGKSAEFRYMLTQLPVTPETTGFVYLSDPFIRRLVGPAMKVGQLRRLKVRAELEMVSAAALLWRLDGHAGKADLNTLTAMGYLPTDFASKGYVLRDDLSAESPDYGTPGHMKSLVESPISQVTPEEQAAYDQYVNEYAQFWRQYFDPIAFRLEEKGGGEMKLTTFILPLIDSSIYNGLKQGLQGAAGAPLAIPLTDPNPVLSLSINLNDTACAQLAQGLTMIMGDEARVEPLALGPSVHLIVNDRDPIVTFGGGDILGVFGGNLLGRGNEMLLVPVVLSILTRPCEIMIEAQDPQAVRNALRRAADMALPRAARGELAMDVYRQGDRDEWILSLGVAGTAKVRFGVGVRDKYVVIRNMPWNPPAKLASTSAAELGAAALVTYPEAGVLQFPSLYMAAKERERYAAIQGSLHLYPMFLCGAKSVQEAGEMCRKLFGFVPEHPEGGSWSWTGSRVHSDVFGDTFDPKQPEYSPQAGAFGVFAGIKRLALNMQFEDDGLRVVTTWQAP